MSARAREGRISTRPASSNRPNEEDCTCLNAGLQVVQTRLQKTWPSATDVCKAASGPLGAYRVVSREQALGRWLTGVPEDKKATLVPPGWFDAWADATFASDPWVLPNGLLLPKRGRDCLRLPPSFS